MRVVRIEMVKPLLIAGETDGRLLELSALYIHSNVASKPRRLRHQATPHPLFLLIGAAPDCCA